MERIGIVSENSEVYVKLILEMWNKGNSVVLIDWRIPGDEIVKLFKSSNVKQCFIDRACCPDFAEDSQLKVFEIGTDKNAEVTPINEDIRKLFYPNYSQEEAVILFSSGTTGEFKGIRLSHYAIQTNADAIISYIGITEEDKIYITKALPHSSTLVGELLVGLKSGADIYISTTLISPNKILSNIEKTGATILCLNPTLLYLYTKAMENKRFNLLSLKKIYISGAILHQKLLSAAREVFENSKVYNVYGLTEAGPRVCAQTDDNYDLPTVGRPISGVDVRIFDAKQNEVLPDVKGSVFVKTESQFIGYVYSNDSETIVNNTDKWIRTGDIGHRDEHGNIYIDGRDDDMIIVGSHNVFPSKIEEEILRYIGIKDCSVFGIENHVYGEIIVCIYENDERCTVSEKELKKHCFEHLAIYESPNKFIQVNNIPKTAGGKKSAKLSRALFEDAEKNCDDKK